MLVLFLALFGFASIFFFLHFIPKNHRYYTTPAGTIGLTTILIVWPGARDILGSLTPSTTPSRNNGSQPAKAEIALERALPSIGGKNKTMRIFYV